MPWGLLQRRRFDLVLLDINMPGLDGVDACRKIRSIAPQTGIVMVTVRDAEEDKVRALEAGADDYVTKPFRFRELVARMGAVLRRTRAHSLGEPSYVEAGGLTSGLSAAQVVETGRRDSSFSQGIRSPGFPDEESGRSHDPCEALGRGLGGLNMGGELEYLRSYIRMLRKKIEDDPAQPSYLVTRTLGRIPFQQSGGLGSPSGELMDDE